MTNYASLNEGSDVYGEYGAGEYGIPHQHISEPTRSQWSHIEDLDSFFMRVYKYHQKHGYSCIVLREIMGLFQVVLVGGIAFIFGYAIDYQALFKGPTDDKHVILSVLIPFNKVIANLSFSGYFLFFFLSLIFLYKLVRKIYTLIMYWDIKQFYNQALLIHDSNLDNLTWHDVQKRLIEVQLELQMCIHKRELTELDIYHRILRQTNYLVALVNKKLLPPKISVPLLGEVVYWTKNLNFIIMFLFFWSPWSPFENPWHLREEYKRPGYREKMANQLRKQVLWIIILTIIALPLLFMGQIIYNFFYYVESVRRDPGKFGVRYWSLYARLYFRHFNELDHELHARLARAYKPATKYMSSFCSPLMSILAEHLVFIAGSVLGILALITFWDNDVLRWDQLITTLAVLTGLVSLGQSLIPDKTTIWCPEQLLQAVVLHTHYLPGVWQGYAHTCKVRSSFQQLFQYRFAAIVEEFLSPLFMPYVLIRYIYPRTLDFVDFFRNFTVSVVGVGDVCSFAQMDIRKHGNPDWQAPHDEETADSRRQVNNQYTQAEDGKVELSLMHFTVTNPNWQPPPEALEFVDNVNLESNRALDNDLIYGPFGVLSSMELPQNINIESFHYCNPAGDNTSVHTHNTNNQSVEGPNSLTSIQNMFASTVTLHKRHAMRQPVQVVRSVEETTPLLSRK